MTYELPKEFVTYCKEELEDADALLESLNQPAPTSIRVNPKKLSLGEKNKIPWSEFGYYLSERPTFTVDPIFHAGGYYVQEASSMLLEQITQFVDAEKELTILDLCASPGGKSTHLLSLFPNSLVVSNEIIRKRAFVLAENITKWGSENSIVTNANAEQLGQLAAFFDVIVVDAPCSGEGMFRKDPNARSEWSSSNVSMCATRQTEILEAILPALKPGGILVYSTCTFNKEENERTVETLVNECDMEHLPIQSPHDGIVTSSLGNRMYPSRISGEGFFISFLRSGLSHGRKSKPYTPKGISGLSQQEFTNLRKYIPKIAQNGCFKYNDMLHFFHERFIPTLGLLQKHCGIIQFGSKLGKFVHGKFHPDPTSHFNTNLQFDVPFVSLDLTQSIVYLRRESPKIEELPTDGWALVTFEKFNLGWVKVIGNRVNNYYPSEYRILNPNLEIGFTILQN